MSDEEAGLKADASWQNPFGSEIVKRLRALSGEAGEESSAVERQPALQAAADDADGDEEEASPAGGADQELLCASAFPSSSAPSVSCATSMEEVTHMAGPTAAASGVHADSRCAMALGLFVGGLVVLGLLESAGVLHLARFFTTSPRHKDL